MNDVLGIRAWYSDGRTFDATRFQDFPEEGAYGFVEFEDAVTAGGIRYRRIVGGGDWYYLDDAGRIQKVQPDPTMGQWAEKPPGCQSCIKRSAPHLPAEEWDRIDAEMMEAAWPT